MSEMLSDKNNVRKCTMDMHVFSRKRARKLRKKRIIDVTFHTRHVHKHMRASCTSMDAGA